jgi:hypothetical protein
MLDITRDERGLPTDFQYDRGTGGVQVAAIGYDAAGRLQSVHFGSGIHLARDLDPRSLELGRTYDRSGPVLTVTGGTAATAYDANTINEASLRAMSRRIDLYEAGKMPDDTQLIAQELEAWADGILRLPLVLRGTGSALRSDIQHRTSTFDKRDSVVNN